MTRILFIASMLFLPPLAAETIPPEQPLMEAGVAAVTPLDLDAMLAEAPAQARYQTLKRPDRLGQLTEQILITRLAAGEAQAEGLDKDPLVQAQLRRLRERFLLKLVVDRLSKEPMPDLSAAAREQYDAHPENYRKGEQVMASHILVRTKPLRKGGKGEVHSREEALAIIQEVEAKAKAGEDFSELARKYSEDPSVKRNKGTLGWFGRGKMVKPFEQAAFKLRKKGDLSPIVESDFGFHLIRLEADYRPGKEFTFEEVKPEILRGLEVEYRNNHREEYLIRLKTEAKPVLHEDRLEQYINERLEAMPGAKQLEALSKPKPKPKTEPAQGQ